MAGAVALLMAAVGGSSTSAGAGETTRPRPAGPSAAFSDISGGNGVFLGDPIPVNLERAGYVEHEYAASGTRDVVHDDEPARRGRTLVVRAGRHCAVPDTRPRAAPD